MDKPSVMYGQCDARPIVAFPAVGRRRPLADTNLYCLVVACVAFARDPKGRGFESLPVRF